MNKKLIFFIIAILSSLAQTVTANEGDSFFNKIQYHGFVTQGYTYTTNNNFFGESSKSNGSFEFTEIGLNGSSRITNNILASAQILSRKTGALYDGSPTLDYGLLDFSLVSMENWVGGVRVGRTKNPYGFYNDSRDVAVTRPSILLPQSIYFDKVRNLIHHSDGLQVYADIQLDNADIFFQSSYGNPSIDKNVEFAFLSTDFPGRVKADDPLSLSRLIYEWQGGVLRFGYTKALGNVSYQPALAPNLNPFAGPIELGKGTIDIDIDLYSFEYNSEHWSLTAEYWLEAIDWQNLGPLFDSNDLTAEGYYVQTTYRHRPDLEFFLRYDVSHLNKDDPNGTVTASSPSAIAAQISPHNLFSKDWTMGIRWDMTKNLMLRAEYHNVQGTSWISSRETPFSETKPHWQMFNLLLSWHF